MILNFSFKWTLVINPKIRLEVTPIMLVLYLFSVQLLQARLRGLVAKIAVSQARGPGSNPGWEGSFVVFLPIPPIFRGRFKGVPTGGY